MLITRENLLFSFVYLDGYLEPKIIAGMLFHFYYILNNTLIIST